MKEHYNKVCVLTYLNNITSMSSVHKIKYAKLLQAVFKKFEYILAKNVQTEPEICFFVNCVVK